MTEFQAGFVATVGEYFHIVVSTGHPNFAAWVPDTVMNDSELKARRAELLKSMREDEAEIEAAIYE